MAEPAAKRSRPLPFDTLLTIQSIVPELWVNHILHELSLVDLYCLSLTTHALRSFVRTHCRSFDMRIDSDTTLTECLVSYGYRLPGGSWTTSLLHAVSLAHMKELPASLIIYACARTSKALALYLGRALRRCASDAAAIRLVEGLRECWLKQSVAMLAVIVSGRIGVLDHWPHWRRALQTTDCLAHAIASESVDMVDKILHRLPNQYYVRTDHMIRALRTSDEMADLFFPRPLPRATPDMVTFFGSLQHGSAAMARLLDRYGDRPEVAVYLANQ
jgi:hypothetical protein